MKSSFLFRSVLGTLAVVLLLAAGGYTAYWHVTAERLRAGLDNWAAARRAEGYAVAWRQAAVTGFPLRFRIVLDGASLARGNPAAYRVSAPVLSGVAAPWDLSRWQVAAPRGASGTAQGVAGTVAAQALSGTVALGAEATRFDLAATSLAGAGARVGEIDAAIVLPRRPPQSHRDLGLDAAIQVFHVTLPQPVRSLGDTIETLAVAGRIMGGLPPGDWRQSLAAWRDQGGTVEISRATVQWGALRLEARGTLALDGAMQPMAALTASIVDHNALIDSAVAAGLLPRSRAGIVKLVLDLLARRGDDGRPRLTAPVTVQDGKLAIGSAEIGAVPRIKWR